MVTARYSSLPRQYAQTRTICPSTTYQAQQSATLYQFASGTQQTYHTYCHINQTSIILASYGLLWRSVLDHIAFTVKTRRCRVSYTRNSFTVQQRSSSQCMWPCKIGKEVDWEGRSLWQHNWRNNQQFLNVWKLKTSISVNTAAAMEVKKYKIPWKVLCHFKTK